MYFEMYILTGELVYLPNVNEHPNRKYRCILRTFVVFGFSTSVFMMYPVPLPCTLT